MKLARSSLLLALALTGTLAGCGDDAAPSDTSGSGASGGGAGGGAGGNGSGGSGGAGGAGGGTAEAIQGTSRRHFVTDAGEETLPEDLQGTTINAWVLDDAGGFTKLPGAGAADGTFTIPGVPEGPYTLEIRQPGLSPAFTVTSSRAPALDSTFLGRPDALAASAGTALTLDVTGLSAWQEEDDNVLFSTNAGTIAFSLHLNAAAGAPMPGDTAFTGMVVDYPAVYSGGLNAPRLIQASKGDEAHFIQLVHSTGPEGVLFVAQRHCATSTLEMVDEQSTPLACALEDVAPTETFPVRMSRAGFEGHLPEVHPAATIHESEVVARALPGAVEHGLYSGAPEIFIFESSEDPGDITADIAYGNPYPQSWDAWVTYLTSYYVPLLAPGATTPIDVRMYLRNELPLAMVDGSLVAPILTPVQDLRVNGLPGFEEHAGVGASPAVSWMAPEVGQAGYYQVVVHRFYNDGGSTRRAVAGRIETTETSVTIPPGVMVAGEHYAVQVIAWTGKGLPLGGAPAITSLMTP